MNLDNEQKMEKQKVRDSIENSVVNLFRVVLINFGIDRDFLEDILNRKEVFSTYEVFQENKVFKEVEVKVEKMNMVDNLKRKVIRI